MGKMKYFTAYTLISALLLIFSAQMFINHSTCPWQRPIAEQVEEACNEIESPTDLVQSNLEVLYFSLLTFSLLKAQLPSAMHACFETPPSPIKIHRTILFRSLKIPQA